MIKLISAGVIGALLSVLSSGPASAKEKDTITGEIHYIASDVKNFLTQRFEYSDSWLEIPSSEAPFEMMRFALCASVSASRQEDVTNLFDQIGYSYTNNVNEEEEGLNVLAGDEITDSVYYPANTVNGIPYYNSIAYAIGSKEVGDLTSIMVCIRGGAYGIEWGGNFDIGTGENHKGFELAADQVIEGINNYIKTNGITGKKKIWFCGYSRGAAVANIAAAKVIDGQVEGMEPDDVYAFCFECPRNTKNPDAFNPRYNGIRNATNPDDLVPKTAMAAWGFRRFGYTYFYPSHESDVNYQACYENMLAEQKKILPFMVIAAQNDQHTLDTFATNLAISAVDQAYYERYYQNPLMAVAAAFLGGGKDEPTEGDWKALRELEMSIGSLNPDNAQRMLKLVDAKPNGNGMFDITFDCPLLKAHWMETSMSWIHSYTGYEDFGPDKIRLGYLSGAKNLEVKDKDGNLVLSIKDGELAENESGLWAQFDPNGQIVFVMPSNGSYTVSVKVAEQGVANYSVAEFDMNYGRKRKVVDFGQVPVEPLDKIESLIGPVGSENTYSLLVNDKIVEPKGVFTDDEVKYYVVRTKVEGDGQAIGGGEVSQGEIVGLYANPGPEKAFAGWYVGDELVSENPVYQTIPTESFEAVAKFTDK